MLTKQIFALLSLGGELRATRTFPHPHHYSVKAPSLPAAEVTADDVIRLLDEKRIAPPHASAIGDDYAYSVTDPVWLRQQALDGFKVGFGRCPVCNAFPLAASASGCAPRHGHTKGEHAVPPCEGSGKPLVQVVSHAPLQAAA